MRLKRLELFGFKSFADRMVLDFAAPVVGIVGPNGCGKSNVVDAVRWVLGEQRPTSMRGGEMVDVIFKGSASRPALSVAEVTLVPGNLFHIGLYTIRDRTLNTVTLYVDFDTFATALETALGGGATLFNLGSIGQYTSGTHTIASALTGVVLN